MQSTEKLQIAKQKLQALDVHFQIRITAYLRICCFVLDPQCGIYSKLMQALYNHDANWWQTCEITTYGGLQSTDPVVTDLLHSIESLHEVNQPQEADLQPQESDEQPQAPEPQLIAA